MARELGLNKTARLLGLDYYSLKKRLQAESAPAMDSPSGPGFVELQAAYPSAAFECVLELQNAQGTQLKLQFAWQCGAGSDRSEQRLLVLGAMIQLTPQMRILVAVEAVDFRSGIDGLARICKQQLQADPFSGAVHVFRNRRSTSIKALVYD